MAQALIVLAGERERAKARKWVTGAPVNTRVVFRGPKRSLPQNDRFWASLTAIAEQLSWHGQKLTPDDWRLLFLAALGGEMRIVPNLSGNGFVDLGRSSSKLDKADFSDLLEIVNEFAARNGVTLGV